MNHAKKIDALRQAVSQYEREHGTLSTCISDQTAVNCQGSYCAGTCMGNCDYMCQDSCHNNCHRTTNSGY